MFNNLRSVPPQVRHRCRNLRCGSALKNSHQRQQGRILLRGLRAHPLRHPLHRLRGGHHQESNAGAIAAIPSSSDGFYPAGTSVLLVASALPPYLFSNWTEGASGTNPQIGVTLNQPVTATAVFVSGGNSTGAGLHFVPVTPCRISDTRSPNGPFGGPILRGGGTRTFLVPQSICGIPSSARAYSLNVTVVPNGPLGYLSIWPTGQSQPFVSTLNAQDGQITANAAIVPAGIGGVLMSTPLTTRT